MFKFDQKVVESKDFYKQRQITNIFTIDVNKVVRSDNVSCINAKDCRYIVGYQVDGIIPLLIKMPKIYLAMACRNTTRTLPIQCHLMFLRHWSGCFSIERFRMRLSHSYLKN